MDWEGIGGAALAVGLTCLGLGGCGGSGHAQAAKTSEAVFLSRESGRVDELRWSSTRHEVSGSMQTYRVDPTAPTLVSTAGEEFTGTRSGSHVDLRPGGGSRDWHGRLTGRTLTLTWTSDGSTITTTFSRSDVHSLDAAQQALDQQASDAQQQITVAGQTAAARAQAQAQQAHDQAKQAEAARAAASRAAVQAAAQARAAAGRAAAAKAAAHGAAHP